jgi:phosphoheptose isomerase
MSNVITDHLRRSAEAKLRAAAECGPSIERAANLIAGSFNGGGKLLICGIVRLTADFVRPGLPAIALTTDSSILTAYTNDFDFDGVFGRQVQALGRPGDVLLGISTSGNSRNVMQAVETARACRVSIVTLTGRHGRLADLADVAIQVPEDVTAHIQEVHLAIEHILCHLIERSVGTPGT